MGHGEYSPSRDSECGAGGHKARHRTHLAESLARDGGSDTTHGAQLQENTGAANQGGNQPRAHTRRERHSSGHVSIQHPREACKPPHRARHNERSPIAGSRGQRRPPQLATAGHRSPRQCGHATTRVHADNARTRGEGRRLEGEAPLPQSSHSCNAQLLGSETAPTRRAQLRTPMLWLHARAKQQLIKRANFCRKLLKRNCLHGDDQMTHRAAMME